MLDPVASTWRTVDEETAMGLRGEAFALYRRFGDTVVDFRDLVRFGFRGLGADVGLLFAMGVAAGLLAMAVPIATGLIFTHVVPKASVNELIQVIARLFAAALGAAGFELTRAIVMLRLESRVDWCLQSAVFDRLLRLPTAFFKQFTSGDLRVRPKSLCSGQMP